MSYVVTGGGRGIDRAIVRDDWARREARERQ
jgi:hypothetical protein